MPGIEKFMFDLSFDEEALAPHDVAPAEEPAESAPEPEEPQAPSFSEEELQAAVEQARAEGHGRGLEEGRAEITANLEHASAEALEAIAGAVPDLRTVQQRALEQLERDTVQLTRMIVAKMLPEYARRDPLMEIESLVGTSLANLFEAQKVLVRVHPELLKRLEQRMGELAKSRGFDGQVLVIGEEGIKPGDARVDWGTGSAERDSSAVWNEIRAIIERTVGPDPAQAGPDLSESTGSEPDAPPPDTADAR